MRRLILLAIAALPAAPTAATTTSFFDTEFFGLGTTYTTQIYNAVGYATGVQVVTDGIFGQNRALEFNYLREGANPSGRRMQAFNETFTYNPGTQGVITSITAQLSQSMRLSNNFNNISLAGVASTTRILARQAGKIYEAARAGPAFPGGSGYTTDIWTGLTAADFLLFDPANPGAPRTLTGLDFAGGVITFGFELTPFGTILSNGQPATGTTTAYHRGDNFGITVNALDPPPPAPGVPEPATWLTMIAGFGLIGGAARRRRQAQAVMA